MSNIDTMRITTKGQVTIPLNIRERYGFLPNTEVQFVEENGQVVLKKAIPRAVRESPFDYVRGSSDVGLTTEQLMRLTRGEDETP